MLGKILLFFAVLIGLTVMVHNGIQDRSLLAYLDKHPHPKYSPPAHYYIGQGLYIFQNLSEAATYFIRVPERYPASSYADGAYFAYVQCLEDDPSTPRDRLVIEYQRYLELYPNGKHAQAVERRIDAYKSGAH